MTLDLPTWREPDGQVSAGQADTGQAAHPGQLWHILSALAGHLSAWQTSAAIVAVSALLLVATVRLRRGVRSATHDTKLSVGTFLVQAGVTWAVVTGTYVACTRLLHVSRWEAVIFAVFFESATWVSVGMIRAHGKGVDADGKPNLGFGPAGPFFWIFTTCGGLLAIIGADTLGAKVGRTLIVVIGACLWYLQLLRWTKRSDQPGTWRWTPRRLLVAIGAIEPGDQDVTDQHREWQIRRLARAMRWTNSRWPLSWLGQRALISRGEATQEDVIADARRRYAVTHLLTVTADPNSDVMRRVIADINAGQADTRPADTVQHAERTADIVAAADTPDMSARTPAADSGQVDAAADRTVVDITAASARRRVGGQVKAAPDTVSVDELADTLGQAYPGEYVGTPKALAKLREVYGSCSKERAIAAKDLHNSRREPAAKPASDDDAEERAV